MQAINSLIEKSFEYSSEKENLAVRRNEIGDLMEVVAYCQNEAQTEIWEEQRTMTVVFY